MRYFLSPSGSVMLRISFSVGYMFFCDIKLFDTALLKNIRRVYGIFANRDRPIVGYERKGRLMRSDLGIYSTCLHLYNRIQWE